MYKCYFISQSHRNCYDTLKKETEQTVQFIFLPLSQKKTNTTLKFRLRNICEPLLRPSHLHHNWNEPLSSSCKNWHNFQESLARSASKSSKIHNIHTPSSRRRRPRPTHSFLTFFHLIKKTKRKNKAKQNCESNKKKNLHATARLRLRYFLPFFFFCCCWITRGDLFPLSC